MDKYNLSVLAEAKQEYTKQLVNILYPHIYTGIHSIYEGARNFCDKSNDTNILKKFQQLMSMIPKWNTDRIDEEYKRIVKITECDWIEDLITAVFVSHTKVLTSIKVKQKNKKAIELNVPNGPYFLHKCYVETARNFWKKPYLLYHIFPNIDLQRNLSDAEHLIKESIEETIRKQLPVKHILQEYLGKDYQDDDVNEDISSEVSNHTRDNLRKLVKYEIEQTLSKKSHNLETHSVIEVEDPAKVEDVAKVDVAPIIEEPSHILTTDVEQQIKTIIDESPIDKETAINMNGGNDNEEPIEVEENTVKKIVISLEPTVEPDQESRFEPEHIVEDVKPEATDNIKVINIEPKADIIKNNSDGDGDEEFSFFEDAAQFHKK